MHPTLSVCVSPAALAAAVLAAQAARADLVETRSIEDRVPVDSASKLRVVVDDVFGFVHVTAGDAGAIEMTATETVRGKTRSDLERARAEVALRTERDTGEVAFLVRRPDGQCDCSSNRWNGYVVKYDIELRVPRGASLDLATVNDGDIVVDGVEGDFEVSNVNGAVRLSGLRGTGHVSTVNGAIEAAFAGAPASGVSFKTVNGDIDAVFPAELSADLQFKTMHGEIWTDFAGEPIASSPVRKREPGENAWVIRSAGGGLRVAAGGPTLSFETLNGDIVVRKAGATAGRTNQ
jgi:hypothetical protein